MQNEIMEREPQLSFGDVVYRVGYLNEKYFAKIFQEKEGVTFAEYRLYSLHPCTFCILETFLPFYKKTVLFLNLHKTFM